MALLSERRWLAILLALACLTLFVTAIPETFTVDECNYFSTLHALREGGLFVPGTDALTPSRELVGFDPMAHRRLLEAGKVSPSAPPLWAPLALGFSYLGWRGLILLNVLAFAATVWLVFKLVERSAERRHTPFVGAALYAFGGFCFDYAQGAWPHMLCVALTTAAVWLTFRARDADRVPLVAIAGCLVGLATGIRYQHIVFAFALGLTVLVWTKRRWRFSFAYAGGIALPMACTSLINHARLGTYNPISKGAWYLPKSPPRVAQGGTFDVAGAFWARVVDFSSHPPFQSSHGKAALPKSPDTGAFLVVGGLKKALLQSAPWIALALCAFVLVWTSRSKLSNDKRDTIRQLAVPAVFMIALFSWAGLERHDGWAFNQRYLLELVPLFAVTVAIFIDDWELDAQRMVIGGAVGLALAAVPIVAAVPEHAFRQRALMIVPVALAGALLVVSLLATASARRLRAAFLTAGVGWALVVHLGDDIPATRGLRDWNGYQRNIAARHLPDAPSALIAISPQKEAMCPLHLDHDVVLVDPQADGAEQVDTLVGELLAGGRRVYVMGGLPQPWLAAIFRGRRVEMLTMRPMPMAEVLPGAARPQGSRGGADPGGAASGGAASGGSASLQQRKPVE